jgi:hypothetical protein
MGRNKQDNEAHIIEQMQKVIDRITGNGNLSNLKTWDDLRLVAYQWCCKDYGYSKSVADDWGVAPIYLLLTALLYVEHPLLVGEGRSWLYSLQMSITKIFKIELNRIDVVIPIKSTDSLHRHVERIAQPVERIEN